MGEAQSGALSLARRLHKQRRDDVVARRLLSSFPPSTTSRPTDSNSSSSHSLDQAQTRCAGHRLRHHRGRQSPKN